MDANKHVTKGKLFSKLAAAGIQLEEFSNKYWGTKQPHTFLNSTLPIDGAYKTKDVEVVNFAMFPFSISPGDHRTFMLDITMSVERIGGKGGLAPPPKRGQPAPHFPRDRPSSPTGDCPYLQGHN